MYTAVVRRISRSIYARTYAGRVKENRWASLCGSPGKKCFSCASRSGVPSEVSRPFIASHVFGDVVCAIFDRVYARKRGGYACVSTVAIALWMLHFFAHDFCCNCTRGCHFGLLHLRMWLWLRHLRKWLRRAVTALVAHLLKRNRIYSRQNRWVIQSYIYVCLLYFQLYYNIIWYRYSA